MTDLTNPAAVMQRLAEIERDLAERQNEFEQAAGDVARLIRDYKKREAQARLVATGKDVAERNANALLAIAAADDSLWSDLQAAEAAYEAQKAAISVLDKRASIGQSILKGQGQGMSRSAVEPAWSRSAA